MQTVDEELQSVQAASSLAMTAQYNVTFHKNTSAELNNTALGAEGNLKRSEETFNEMKLRVNTVTNLTNEALFLINGTKVCRKVWDTHLKMWIKALNEVNLGVTLKNTAMKPAWHHLYYFFECNPNR